MSNSAKMGLYAYYVGRDGRVVERRTVNRGDGGLNPPAAVSKLRLFRNPTYACEETLKASGSFYLVSMSEEIKDPTCNL